MGERRDNAEMQKRIAEERQKRYDENDKKRAQKIAALEAERKQRDMDAIREIIEESRVKKERLAANLDAARHRKLEMEKEHATEMQKKKEAEDRLNEKREQRIAERNERLRKAERDYLELRQKQIEEIAE